MALHAIKAGEGDVFISAGVETVSRFARGSSDAWPDTHNPLFAEAEERTARRPERRSRSGTTRGEDGLLPDVYIAMGQTAENLALRQGRQLARRWTTSGCGRRTWPSRRSRTDSGPARSRR